MTNEEKEALQKRIEDARQRIRDESEPWPTHPDVGPYQGPPFTPYATMFKMNKHSELEGPALVHCVSCNWGYPFSDILEGELEEDNCPNCGTWAQNFYSNKPHRKVPANG